MTKSGNMASTEALFGSAARRDGDSFSDVDYLIVDDDPQVLRARKRWLTARGFSVSEFSWRRLETAFRAGTLFALHLQREARIVVDGGNRLLDLFESYEPKASYVEDFDHSLELLRPLEAIPATPRGRAWALDVLSVAFRNSAILARARDGEFVFSYQRLIEDLRQRRKLSDNEACALRKLRSQKAGFRMSEGSTATQAALDQALRAVASALGVDFSARVGRRAEVSIVGVDSTMAYSRMRSLEAELISVPLGVMRIPEARRIHQRLYGFVRDPHGYLWRFMHGSSAIGDHVARLRSYY